MKGLPAFPVLRDEYGQLCVGVGFYEADGLTLRQLKVAMRQRHPGVLAIIRKRYWYQADAELSDVAGSSRCVR